MVQIQNYYRQANWTADWLFKKGATLPHGVYFVDTPPPPLVRILNEDILGFSWLQWFQMWDRYLFLGGSLPLKRTPQKKIYQSLCTILDLFNMFSQSKKDGLF